MAETKYYGIYQGIVTSIKDPEKRARIRVMCPEVLGIESESAWCDPVIPVAYDYGGDFCIPHIDEAVWIMFIDGDPDSPVYLGGWFSEKKTPLGDNYTDLKDIRIISYANCMIVMHEGSLDINVGGECSLTIEDNKIKIKGDVTVEGNLNARQVKANNIPY